VDIAPDQNVVGDVGPLWVASMRRYEETLHFVAADEFLQEKVAAPLRRLPLTITPANGDFTCFTISEDNHFIILKARVDETPLPNTLENNVPYLPRLTKTGIFNGWLVKE